MEKATAEWLDADDEDVSHFTIDAPESEWRWAACGERIYVNPDGKRSFACPRCEACLDELVTGLKVQPQSGE